MKRRNWSEGKAPRNVLLHQLHNMGKATVDVSALIRKAERAAEERAVQCRPMALALDELVKAVNARRLR